MYLAKMTWEEVREYLKTGDTLLIPVGTCEQHGYHSPLGTDSLVAGKMCEIIARKYNLLIAPPVNYGVHFDVDNDYPGVAVVTPETMKMIFRDLGENWVGHGFRKLVIVTFHGVPDHHKALEDLGDNYYLIKASEGEISDILEKQESMVHSCEAETSVMLYLFPELLKMEKVVDTDHLEDFREHMKNNRRFDINKYPGNLGYSSYATREKGERIMERLMQNIENQLKEILAKN